MEQKDYLLREIEKIGMIISVIRQKLFGGSEDLSISIEHQMDDLKGMLLDEADFDIDKFLSSDVNESNEYVISNKGFSVENIEQFADLLSQIALAKNSADSKKYLQKALQLYELCNLKSKTYSVDREKNIMKIKNALLNKNAL